MEEQTDIMRKNWVASVLDYFSPQQMVIFSLVILGAVGFLDYAVTNVEVRFTAFYFIPIVLISWRMSLKWIVGFVVCVSSCWFYNDQVWRETALRSIDFWNLFVATLSFIIIASLVYLVRKGYEDEKYLNTKLKALIESQEKLLEEVKKLQNNVIVMCAWSHKIKDQGQWISLENFLNNHFQLKISHGISPEEVEKIQKKIDLPENKSKS